MFIEIIRHIYIIITNVKGGENIKKGMICLILLTFIVFTGIAFASDTNSTDYELAESPDEPLTDTISVDGDTFKDIQDKIDESNDGDTIYLNGKTYIGNGTQITLNKSITIDGSSPNGDSKAIIDANDSSRAFYANGIYNIILKNIIFQKLKFVESGGAIYQDGGNLTIMNCEAKDVNVSTGYVYLNRARIPRPLFRSWMNCTKTGYGY